MADYIMELRALVGSRPLLQVGASVIVVDADGRLLLQCRGDDGSWGYAGGSVELEERVEDAAVRELAEETGLIADPDELELFGVYSGPAMAHTYPNGDRVSNVDVVFICRRWRGVPSADDREVCDLAFFMPDALPEPVFLPNRPALADWLHQTGYSAPWL